MVRRLIAPSVVFLGRGLPVRSVMQRRPNLGGFYLLVCPEHDLIFTQRNFGSVRRLTCVRVVIFSASRPAARLSAAESISILTRHCVTPATSSRSLSRIGCGPVVVACQTGVQRMPACGKPRS